MVAISPCFCGWLTNGNNVCTERDRCSRLQAVFSTVPITNSGLDQANTLFTIQMLKCYGSTCRFCSSLYFHDLDPAPLPVKPWPHLWYFSHIPFYKATGLTCSVSLQVLPSPSPSLYKDATHLFADFTRLKPGDFRVDVSVASNQGVTCLKPEYIADYLMQVSECLNELQHFILCLCCVYVNITVFLLLN